MQIFPAIDIRGGRVVRLKYGDYQQMEVYSQTPLEAAAAFREAGAACLHIVDLDGAKGGEPVNFPLIAALLANSGMFAEVGGGIRDLERVERYLAAGAGRVILGTAAWQNPAFLERALSRYGEQIAVGVDAREGRVAVNGWLETTALDGFAFCQSLAGRGVRTVVYTDISRDGALSGTNLAAYRRLSAIKGLNIVASGGIAGLEEIVALRELGVSGAILGKALYAGKLDLKAALDAAKGGERA